MNVVPVVIANCLETHDWLEVAWLLSFVDLTTPNVCGGWPVLVLTSLILPLEDPVSMEYSPEKTHDSGIQCPRVEQWAHASEKRSRCSASST
jgi:hypothetical protein